MDRVRRRWLRPEVSPNDEEMGPITLKAGASFQVPSDDEDAPNLPHGAASLLPRLAPLSHPRILMTRRGIVSAPRAAKHPKGRAINWKSSSPNVLALILNMHSK